MDAEARLSWSLDADLTDVTSAYVRPRNTDPKSSYGDMVAVSDVVDVQLACFLSGVLSDGIIAPSYEAEAVDILSRKKKGGYLDLRADPGCVPPKVERRDVGGVVLEQQRDTAPTIADLLGGADVPVVDALLAKVTLLGSFPSVVYDPDRTG